MTYIEKSLLCLGVVLGFCASLLPYSSYADTRIDAFPEHISVSVEDYLQLSIISGTGKQEAHISYDDVTHTYSGSVANGNALQDFGVTVLGAVTNNINGWKLNAKSTTKNAGGNATLVGATTGLSIASSSVSLDGSTSTWTMSVASGEGSPVIASGFSSAHVVPTDASTSTLIATGAGGNERRLSVTYGVGISPTQAADTYVGSVEYILSINNGQ